MSALKALNSAPTNVIATNGRTETFGYDNLDRLTSATVTGQAANTVTYNSGASTGNIATKTSVGTYSYDSGKIHAVASITNPNGTVPTGTQNITYTAYHQPNTIIEGINKVTFTYGPDYERRKMVIEQNNVVQSTRYYFGSYEKIVSGGTTTHLHYIGSGAGLVAIVSRVGSTDTYNYTYTDHLGSILTVTNASGTVIAEQNFDAWGRSRNPIDWTFTNVPIPPAWLIRSYTGHEHLPQFNLINMNGRVYDPILGRMLSPDNYVQTVNSTQNFNRYAYVMNNPLKYKDPNGELLLTFLIEGIKGAIRGENFFRSGGKGVLNELKIYGGLFASDPNKGFGGRVWEIASRFTWQSWQTGIGMASALFTNRFRHVTSVEYAYGSTVIRSNGSWGAFTLGSYINGDNSIRADADNPLFQHEYGHYLQSQAMGPAYLSRVAIPSALDNDNYFGEHDFHPIEQDANRRAFLYFNKNVPGFQDDALHYNADPKDNLGWDFWRNPLNVNSSGNRAQYVDYQNSIQVASLNLLRTSAKWYDYVGGGWGVGIGLWNAAEYNESIFWGKVRF